MLFDPTHQPKLQSKETGNRAAEWLWHTQQSPRSKSVNHQIDFEVAILPVCSEGVTCLCTGMSVLPVCAWDWACCSCRLWLSTEMPLSLCSFSPSGDGVWFWLAVQLSAPCLFCLQLFHLNKYVRHEKKNWTQQKHRKSILYVCICVPVMLIYFSKCWIETFLPRQTAASFVSVPQLRKCTSKLIKKQMLGKISEAIAAKSSKSWWEFQC